MKRQLLSLALALALCLGLAAPALAAEEKTLTRDGLAVLLARYVSLASILAAVSRSRSRLCR